MINQQTLLGNWNEIKGKLRSNWGSLTDDDLTIIDGNVDQLVGAIQRKTGEARESIEHFLEQLTSNGAAVVSRAGETVRAESNRRLIPSRKRPKKSPPRCVTGLPKSSTRCRNDPPNRWRFVSVPA